jgi:hypothetical protein
MDSLNRKKASQKVTIDRAAILKSNVECDKALGLLKRSKAVITIPMPTMAKIIAKPKVATVSNRS